MPTKHKNKQRAGLWRVWYTIEINGNKQRRSKSVKSIQEADTLMLRLAAVEQATRTGVATLADIEEWIAKQWITRQDANSAFTGFAETARRNGTDLATTDFRALLDAYAERSLRKSKKDPYGKNHSVNMSRAKQAIQWCEDNCPDIRTLDVDDVAQFVDDLRSNDMKPWTVHHYITALRLVLDAAIDLQMIASNPARSFTHKQPKRSSDRRILNEAEINWLLDASLEYRQWISGCLPTLVRLGLYAGLRNQEMIWLTWDSIDWKKGIITVEKQQCPVTGTEWTPKNYEMRKIDIKDACLSFLQAEYDRQAVENLLGMFVMPGGGATRPADYRKRPLSPIAVHRAFNRFLQAEEAGQSGITIYSLRHTYATSLLRAGVDIRTVQARMGHSSISVTEQYLHEIKAESHPSDCLPY